MKKSILFVFACFIGAAYANAQTSVNKAFNSAEVNQIPKEKVFLHYNSSIIFPGEYLYYSFYCLYAKSSIASQLSKIGYVELVGEDKQVVMRQKVGLENGLGQGDYFVPTDIPSGNYKLVAYTQWMRNSGLDVFFQADITVVNPYQGNQDNLISAVEAAKDSIKKLNTADMNLPSVTGFKLTTDADSYGKRERVALKFDNLLGDSGHGDYSISVRQLSSEFDRGKITSQEFSKLNRNKINSENKILFLPELRGELLPIKITSKTKKTLENVNVSMSIPGENYVFKIANSDSNGSVFFNLNQNYEGETAVFQILDDDNGDFELQSNDVSSVDYSTLDFDQFYLSEEMANEIVNRSVQNQIENAFISLKKDTIQEKLFNPVFNYKEVVSYNLNDYTRFKTVKETMVEIIKDVWTIKKDRKLVFQVRWTGSDLETVVLPLLLLDGMVIQNHEFLANYDSRKIRMIKVLQGKYILGEMVYDGILVFESEKPLAADEIDLGKVLNQNLLNRELSKTYFQPRYAKQSKIKLNTVPDYRSQLFWKPKIRLDQDALKLDFYTSDVTGTFLIEIEGFTKTGKAVSLAQVIKVR